MRVQLNCEYNEKTFKLSAVRLQPSMDKIEKKIDNHLYTKKVGLIKRIY